MNRGHEIKVLDHGFVRLVDYMGSDEAIVEAARMSTGRGFVSWNPYRRCKKCNRIAGITPHAPIQYGLNPSLVEQDRTCGHFDRDDDWDKFPRGDLGILEYLYRNRHTTPFEMCELIIDVMVPMDAWRQWIRHRTASVNEYSTRYSEAIDVAAHTDPVAWRTQSKTNRQGSGETLGLDIGQALSRQEDAFLVEAHKVYQTRLDAGVAKEQARKDLPLSTYTVARWKCNLKNTFHFLGLRMHSHAQLEIRLYANAVAEMVKAIWPRTYALFEEHDLHGVHLSRNEGEALRAFFATLDTAGVKVLETLEQHILIKEIVKKIGERVLGRLTGV